METTRGPLGFTIPVQSLSSSREVKMTPNDVMEWRNHLPMADLGVSAKKVFHTISDCNKVTLGLKERFEILELLRTPVQFISQSLRKHYMNQTSALTKQQWMIANLAETLQLEMAMGYKLIIEQLDNNGPADLKSTILPVVLQRTIHYFTHILIRSYQLYSIPPESVWKELHLVYKHAEKNRLLKQNNLEEDYKRILLLAATYPYQWRQSEQDLLYSATESWAKLINIRDDLPNKSKVGCLALDLNADKPPTAVVRGLIESTSAGRTLDLQPLLEHIKELIKTIEPNELQAKISHHNEPEYVVSTSVLRRLIKEWEKPKPRTTERTQKSEPINVCLGLTAAHYYVNHQKPFQPTQSTESQDGLGLALSTGGLGLQEEGGNIESTEIDVSKVSLGSTESTKASLYQMLSCHLINQTPEGYGLLWPNDSAYMIQAGDVMGLEKEIDGKKDWLVCVIRWLQRTSQNELKVGVDCLAKTAKAGAAQLIKNNVPAGYYLRCLIVNSTVLVPILPFKSGSKINIVLNGNGDSNQMDVELTELVDSTGSYKQFNFITKEDAATKTPPPSTPSPQEKPPTKEEPPTDQGPANPDGFDSIWSNL